MQGFPIKINDRESTGFHIYFLQKTDKTSAHNTPIPILFLGFDRLDLSDCKIFAVYKNYSGK